MDKHRPVITLTSDFGHSGPFVAVMKAVIYNRLPDARIVDINHEIEPHWPAEAGFWLAKSFAYFPQGSIHIAVVDPGVGTARDIIVAERAGHIFLAPDNGLLHNLSESLAGKTYKLSNNWVKAQNWPPPSSTFHGRDIFAPLAAELAAGRIRPGDIGELADGISPSPIESAQLQNAAIHGAIVSIDHFGNLITNIEADMIAVFSKPVVRAAGKDFAMHTTYANCEPGEFLALINSFDVVEISRVNGNAAQALGLRRGAPVVVSQSV